MCVCVCQACLCKLQLCWCHRLKDTQQAADLKELRQVWGHKIIQPVGYHYDIRNQKKQSFMRHSGWLTLTITVALVGVKKKKKQWWKHLSISAEEEEEE